MRLICLLLLVSELIVHTPTAHAGQGGIVACKSNVDFVFGPRYMVVPEKMFLLVRKGTLLGAFHFTNMESDLYRNGRCYEGRSSYESFFQGDGSGSLIKKNVVKRSGSINIEPIKGIHPFAWQPGADKLRVGNWKFGCMGNNVVNMSLGFSEKDDGFEFAPTSAATLTEIDVTDKHLQWFKFDAENRFIVPLTNLRRREGEP
jgi:hypothetical protein